MRYATLFEVEILHDFFLNVGPVLHEALEADDRARLSRRYAVERFLEVVPTEASRAVLAGHRLVFKTTAMGFLVAAQVDPDAPGTRPRVPPEASFRLAFSLRPRDLQFDNYTAVAPSMRAFHRFGNDSGNAVEGIAFLSLPVPGFDPAVAYEAGAIRADDSGATIELYQAIRDTGPSAAPAGADWVRIPADTFEPGATYSLGAVVLFEDRLFRALIEDPGNNLNNPARWELVATLPNQYVTDADRLSLRPSLFTVDVASEGAAELTARVFRAGAADPVWQQGFTAAAGPVLETLQIDLRQLRRGTHRLQIHGADGLPIDAFTESFYLDSDALAEAWLGVIEIGLGAGDHALLDGVGAMRSPRYRLRFLNRPTRWRYVFPEAQAVGATAEVVVEDPESRRLVTPQPQPLTLAGAPVRLQIPGPPGPPADEVLLPVPDAQRVRRDGGQWYSEIHVPNLPL